MNGTSLYVGRVSHVRRSPTAHTFTRPTYMVALDLDDLDQDRWMPVFGIERAAPLSYRRRDYRGKSSRSLKETIKDDVERALGGRPDGRVVLLTHVRAFGFVFNPVSFYYCFGGPRDELLAVVAEITNTPWRERHAYVLRARDGIVDTSFPKDFHVSPFMPMDQTYRWRLSGLDDWLTVRMDSLQAGARVFSAALTMKRLPMTRMSLLRAATSMPLIGLTVLVSIYVHALRLAVKRTPFFAHPKGVASARTEGSVG